MGSLRTRHLCELVETDTGLGLPGLSRRALTQSPGDTRALETETVLVESGLDELAKVLDFLRESPGRRAVWGLGVVHPQALHPSQPRALNPAIHFPPSRT